MSAENAVRIVLVLASALEYVHASGRCHGDVKPSNIGFSSDGVAKLLDFGLSRAFAAVAFRAEDEESPQPAMPAWGTPAYLSPEAWAGKPPDEHLDVWALSVVLCEMVAGRHPYGSARSASEMARRSARTIAGLRPDVSSALAGLLEEFLCDAGTGRPRTAADLRQRLEFVSAQID